MGGKKRVPVAVDYSWEALQAPQIDIENLMEEAVEARFHEGSSLEEGCSGKLTIDTTFENTSDPYMDLVSSDRTRYEDLPAPHDVARHKYPHRRF